ncbi:hypothetical protein H2200_000554 [Cladophialophora chaetospira]|uniref:Uncharacterized protein n=1 Tax=Cladophialophora chaetospira TaxID=386627 RepID=A0AA38XNR8_9EURO|nr:hypothetical protein H2200_000554 [Cladophialophora chaetospira]
MASSGPHGHNPDTCPEEIKKDNAEIKAALVLARVEAIDKGDRGRQEFWASSTEILSDPNPDDTTLFDSAFEAEKYREVLLTKKTPVGPTIPTNPHDPCCKKGPANCLTQIAISQHSSGRQRRKDDTLVNTNTIAKGHGH